MCNALSSSVSLTVSTVPTIVDEHIGLTSYTHIWHFMYQYLFSGLSWTPAAASGALHYRLYCNHISIHLYWHQNHNALLASTFSPRLWERWWTFVNFVMPGLKHFIRIILNILFVSWSSLVATQKQEKRCLQTGHSAGWVRPNKSGSNDRIL